jgi:Fe-S-cluster containining protein
VSKKSKARKQRAAAARSAARTGRDGRVHLALVRDPTTGHEFVTLGKRVFEEAWQNDLVTGAANTARGTLRDEPTLEAVVALAQNAMAATSRLAEGLLARAPEGGVACRAGCDHCCYQSVGATPPETLAIADHLRRTLSKAELAAVAAHVAEVHRRTQGLSAADRFSPDHPCAFLRDGRCSIYEVRPLACRGMNAFDADQCSRRLRDPDTRAAFLADPESLGANSYMEPIRAFHAVSAGLQLSLSEFYDLDMRPLDLAAALDLLLNGPPAQADEWLAGRRPFESALGGDASDEPGVHRLSGAVIPPR